jgi:chemotaxis family two-component system response regulator Rcp1
MGKLIQILLVEDNPADIVLTETVLKKSDLKFRLNVVTDGEDAISFVQKTGKYKDAPTPQLILLDLNLPKKNGHEVLSVIKNDPGTKHIPVVVFSSSGSEEEIKSLYAEHANCYIQKPMDYHHFERTIKAIENYWLSVAKIPSGKV